MPPYNAALKLGLVAGGGALPLCLYQHITAQGGAMHVLGIQGAVDENVPCDDIFPIEHFGAFIKSLRYAGCRQLVILGKVQRPNLLTLRPDLTGLKLLSRVLLQKNRGDDAVLAAIVHFITAQGFDVLPAQEIMPDLLPSAGLLTSASATTIPKPTDYDDMRHAVHIVRQLGALDIGQAAIICRGQVLAVEGVDGTDALLARIAALPDNLRGTAKKRQGVLAKLPKPRQNRAIDMPTIGLDTINHAHAAHLSGVVLEAGGVIVNDLTACIKRANEVGLFIYCLPAGGQPDEIQE